MRGGTELNSEHTKNNDPLQLQQMIIFLKAELAKYKHAVEKYNDNYHYSLAEKLQEENRQLAEEVSRVTHALEKQTSEYEERVYVYEMQGKKDLFPLSKLESKLVKFVQESNQQVATQIETLTRSLLERQQAEEVKVNLIKAIEKKNGEIERLQQELLEVKKQNEVLVEERNSNGGSADRFVIDSELLVQLEQQMTVILAQALEYEKKLRAKFLALNRLEQQMDQLAVEVAGVKTFSVEERVIKEF